MIELAPPLPGSIPTDPFGWRDAIPSIGLPAQLHNGQDFAAPPGTPILAAHDGRIGWNGVDSMGGNGVRLDSSEGWSTLYFHMLEPSPLPVGTFVKEGDPIGKVGATGMAVGPHLHFMLRIKGSDVDPVPYIKENEEMLNTEDKQWLIDTIGHMLAFTAREHGVSADGTEGKTLFEAINSIPDTIFDTLIPRQGGATGDTSLRGTLAWLDSNLQTIIAGVKESAIRQGVDPSVIEKAINDGLATAHYPTVKEIAAAVNNEAAERLKQ